MTFRHAALLLIATSALTACSTDSTGPASPQAIASSSSDSAASSASGSSSSSSSSSSSANRVRLEIALKGVSPYANAKGKAKWSSKPSERELQIEIENVAAGTSVNFFVGGAKVGATQVTNTLRQASINLNSTLGQSVPMSVTGQVVEVKTAAGVLVASGKF
ncbi:MAG: hypothetical protein IPF47_20490 [Gemmatimonadetes bacterium]|nr:hypothetical protein [Gemmatimonadota bacterium]